MKNIEIITANCRLRALEIADAEELYANVFADTSAREYMAWESHTDAAEVREFLASLQSSDEIYLGIFTHDGTLVGTVHLGDENPRAGIVYLTYALGSSFRHRGYMTESLHALLKYAFDELGCRMVTAFCAESNRASQKLLSRLGFVYEGKLRQRDLTAHGLEDGLQYSLLSDELQPSSASSRSISENPTISE